MALVQNQFCDCMHDKDKDKDEHIRNDWCSAPGGPIMAPVACANIRCCQALLAMWAWNTKEQRKTNTGRKEYDSESYFISFVKTSTSFEKQIPRIAALAENRLTEKTKFQLY